MKKIIWLASYPKSGNTWFRIFLENLLTSANTPVNINELNNSYLASSRYVFDELSGVESSNLLSSEIEDLRPLVILKLAEEKKAPIFIKIHDALYTKNINSPIIPIEATLGVVYLIRDPREVAVSFAHHSNKDIDSAIHMMKDEQTVFYNKGERFNYQLTQYLLSWSGHVKSWIDYPGLNILVVSYEDLKKNPLETFSKAGRFIGLDFSEEEIKKAVELSHFKHQRKQEKQYGFIEKNPFAKSFFRKGEIDSWKTTLTPEQVQSIHNTHYEIMERFGYH